MIFLTTIEHLEPLLVRAFFVIALRGDLATAAAELRQPQVELLNEIDLLERRIRADLFDRSSPTWVLSPTGEALLNMVENLYEYRRGTLHRTGQPNARLCPITVQFQEKTGNISCTHT